MPNILIEAPSTRRAERAYVCSTLLGEFLGLEYELRPAQRADWRMTCGEGGELLLPDVFFGVANDAWLKPASLPARPLEWLEPADLAPLSVAERVPVLFGRRGGNGNWLERAPGSLRLGIDLFGACFFMLSRYEETVVPERDTHGRFPARASIASQEGFLDRPVVDEYADLLLNALRALWPQLRRAGRRPVLRLSHDVDAPFLHAFQPVSRLARSVAGDAFKRRRFSAAWTAPRAWLRVRLGEDEADPFYTFDWIMDRSEAAGIRSAFYFICGHGRLGMDGDYEIGHPRMRRLLRRIHERGHEIGLHGSYETIDRPAMLAEEFDRLRRVCREEGIEQQTWGGRQHYLRWRTPETARAWAAAGLDYDSTLAFADQAGFRSGTSREHDFFDVEAGAVLPLRERPLIAMDATLLDARYQAMPREAAYERLLLLRRRCEAHDGDFSLLWHNSRLTEAADRALYEKVVGRAG